jgi:AMMECR1 domain-containing protein
LLPNIEGIDTVERQLSIAQRKAGLSDIDLLKLKVYAFTSTRFY